MNKKISIVGMGSISALGKSKEEVWENYQLEEHTFNERSFGKFKAHVSDISPDYWKEIDELRTESKFKDLDPTVLMAILVSRKAIANANWKCNNFGINIGS